MKPVIGITGNRLVKGVDTFYGHRVTYTQQHYVDAIQGTGGLPVVLPIDKPAAAAQAISLVDGLLLTGGQDVSPHLYLEEPAPEIGAYSPQRDHFEMALVHAALKTGKPIFAICRGLQLVNVALGGSLYQDVNYVKQSLVQHLQHVDETLGSHTIHIEKDSQLNQLFSDKKVVNSLHHQFIKRVADKLVVSARTTDGMIEAMEGSSELASWFIGVQWHPEMMFPHDPETQKLFQLFLQAAQKHE